MFFQKEYFLHIHNSNITFQKEQHNKDLLYEINHEIRKSASAAKPNARKSGVLLKG